MTNNLTRGVDVGKGICSVDGCETPTTARGFCDTHYRRYRRWGDPLGSAPPRERAACSVGDCAKTSDALGLCPAHYRRFRLYGDPLGSATPRPRSARRLTACLIDGCSGVSGLPGSARGWCSAHYNRWRRTGDPLLKKWDIIKATGCAVEGCPQPYASSGLCVAHYSNWLRHGDPAPRKRGEVRGGKKICTRCDRDLPAVDFHWRAGRPLGSCKNCQSEWRAERWRANLSENRQKALEYQKAHPQKARDAMAVRRARKAGASIGAPFSGSDVFERDGWVCGLCSKEIERDAKWPGLDSPSVDHIVPLALGGSHSIENCQAAHLGCNMSKGARVKHAPDGAPSRMEEAPSQSA